MRMEAVYGQSYAWIGAMALLFGGVVVYLWRRKVKAAVGDVVEDIEGTFEKARANLEGRREEPDPEAALADSQTAALSRD